MIVGGIAVASTLINTRYLTYGIVLSKFVKKYNLKRTQAPRKLVIRVSGRTAWMTAVVKMDIDIDGHMETM